MMDDDTYFDVDPELTEYRQALNAAWVLIGRLDMALEQVASPHRSAKERRAIVTKMRAEIERAATSKKVTQ